MDAAVAGLIGASIGAITGLLGSLVAVRQQRKLERQRWEQSRADEVWKEERRSLLELTGLLADGCHQASWLSWGAGAKSIDAVKADAVEYEARMRALLPLLVRAQASASGLSDKTYDLIDPFVERLYGLDLQVSNQSVRLETEPEDALIRLEALRSVANTLDREIVTAVRSQLRLRNQ